MKVDKESFDASVHDALVHLYDLPFLQRSPLLEMLGGPKRDGATGTALHRILLEAIEQLKPPREVSPEAVAWKTYRSLILRYVRSLNAGDTARDLGLSTRQAQRIQLLALKSISTVLWENWRTENESDENAAWAKPPTDPWRAVDEDRILEDEIAAILSGSHGKPEPFPSIVRGALETIGPVLAHRQVTAKLWIDEELGQSIAPHDLTRQALVQLLLGALEVSAPGRLVVSARSRSRGAEVAVSVEPENSLGIPRREPQLPDRRLLVVERLLSAIGGQVSIDAQASVFEAVATLPLGIAPTVLVVEDNPQVVQLFRRYLNGSIYRMVDASDADAALDLARDQQPDVITLDVMMPRRDGWELLQALKVYPETRGIPVLVCSVLRDQELALALGACEFVPKPVTQRALLGALSRHVAAGIPLTSPQ